MEKQALTNKQGSSLIALFLIGNAAIMALGSAAKEDFWLSIILAVLLAWIITLELSFVSNQYPGQNFFEIFESIFGKVLGKTLTAIFTFYTMQTGGIVLRNGAQFIDINGLPYTPIRIVMLCIIVLAIFFVKNGMKVMANCAEVFTGVFAISIFILILFSFQKMKMENVGPFLYRGIKPVILSTFYTFGFPFGEIVTFSLVLSNFQKGVKITKVYRNGLLVGGTVMLIASLNNALVLGVETANASFYPTYMTATRLTIPPFFQGTEVILAGIIVFASFTKLSIYLLASCIGISKLFNIKDYRIIVTPMAIILMIWSYHLFNSVMELKEWDLAVWKEFSFIFQAILPTIVFVSAVIKKKIRGV